MNIAEYMALNGLTDSEMADLLGCDRTRVNRIRRGVDQPSIALAITAVNATKGAITLNDVYRVEAA